MAFALLFFTLSAWPFVAVSNVAIQCLPFVKQGDVLHYTNPFVPSLDATYYFQPVSKWHCLKSEEIQGKGMGLSKNLFDLNNDITLMSHAKLKQTLMAWLAQPASKNGQKIVLLSHTGLSNPFAKTLFNIALHNHHAKFLFDLRGNPIQLSSQTLIDTTLLALRGNTVILDNTPHNTFLMHALGLRYYLPYQQKAIAITPKVAAHIVRYMLISTADFEKLVGNNPELTKNLVEALAELHDVVLMRSTKRIPGMQRDINSFFAFSITQPLETFKLQYAFQGINAAFIQGGDRIFLPGIIFYNNGITEKNIHSVLRTVHLKQAQLSGLAFINSKQKPLAENAQQAALGLVSAQIGFLDALNINAPLGNNVLYRLNDIINGTTLNYLGENINDQTVSSYTNTLDSLLVNNGLALYGNNLSKAQALKVLQMIATNVNKLSYGLVLQVKQPSHFHEVLIQLAGKLPKSTRLLLLNTPAIREPSETLDYYLIHLYQRLHQVNPNSPTPKTHKANP